MSPSRRTFLKRLAAGLAAPVGLGVYMSQVEPFWPEIHEVPLAVPGLPAGFAGLRIAHLTDLHVHDRPSYAYGMGIVRQVNALRPDLTIITGDLVTRGRSVMPGPAAEVVGGLESPVYVSFGNHDYGRWEDPRRPSDVADELQARLAGPRCTVLRNAAAPLERGRERLWLVGLEDLWSGRFSPSQALAGVPRGEVALALSHNPDTAATLDSYAVQWVFAGHTHGGQLRIPGYGAVLIPIQNRAWQQGMFRLKNTGLYVSRGVGYLLPARLACRPEVPIFTLGPA